MGVNIRIPALEKLLDYAASGIGSTAGHLFASRIARREVETKLIAAAGEVRAQRILAEGQATTMQIIAKAQDEARSTLVSSDATVQGEIALGELVTQRIQFQEEKRQANIESVIKQAAVELGDKEIQDHKVDHDWTARFFNDVQDVSSEEMQLLYAKILAGVVEMPGNTTVKTLSILKNLDKSTATLFRKLCSACISMRPDGNSIIDSRVSSLGGDAAHNALSMYGLNFSNLNKLNEHGLIISDFNSWYDLQASIGITLREQQALVHIPLSFQSKYWILIATRPRVQGKEFKLSGVALTRSGQELSRVVDLEPQNQYALDLNKYFEKNNLRMTEVSSWKPQIAPRISP